MRKHLLLLCIFLAGCSSTNFDKKIKPNFEKGFYIGKWKDRRSGYKFIFTNDKYKFCLNNKCDTGRLLDRTVSDILLYDFESGAIAKDFLSKTQYFDMKKATPHIKIIAPNYIVNFDHYGTDTFPDFCNGSMYFLEGDLEEKQFLFCKVPS